MNKTHSLHSVTLNDSFVESDLSPYVPDFIDYLNQGRYAKSTTQAYIFAITHFVQWVNLSQLNIKQLNETTASQFLDEHLPHCDCLAPVCRNYRSLRLACDHFLRILRNNGVIDELVLVASSVDNELTSFDKFMCNVQGLATQTRSGRIRIVRRFLLKRFTDHQFVASAIQPTDVRKFITEQLGLHNTASNASALVCALNAYFRYRSVCGDQVHALTGVIARPAHWSLASLPRSLTSIEVKHLLASFTSDIPSPHRGYAIVRCALDLGLRASEIVNLKLPDIDWKASTVTLRKTKSCRVDIMPLPAVTGQAIADYLQFERPPTINPAVFARVRPPHDIPISVHAIHRVIRDAYRRIGLTHTRVHALRHTLAQQLLEQGGSLKDVADVLRHRSLNTSLIYAKLDTHRLQAVALPWPGSAS